MFALLSLIAKMTRKPVQEQSNEKIANIQDNSQVLNNLKSESIKSHASFDSVLLENSSYSMDSNPLENVLEYSQEDLNDMETETVRKTETLIVTSLSTIGTVNSFVEETITFFPEEIVPEIETVTETTTLIKVLPSTVNTPKYYLAGFHTRTCDITASNYQNIIGPAQPIKKLRSSINGSLPVIAPNNVITYTATEVVTETSTISVEDIVISTVTIPQTVFTTVFPTISITVTLTSIVRETISTDATVFLTSVVTETVYNTPLNVTTVNSNVQPSVQRKALTSEDKNKRSFIYN